MSRGLYAGKILAPNLTSHTIMPLLSRTSLMRKNLEDAYPREDANLREVAYQNLDSKGGGANMKGGR